MIGIGFKIGFRDRVVTLILVDPINDLSFHLPVEPLLLGSQTTPEPKQVLLPAAAPEQQLY